MNRLTPIAAALLVAGCYTVVVPGDEENLGSFTVTVKSVTKDGAPLTVVKTCSDKYLPGTVPVEVRGTPECPYAILKTDATFEIAIQALNGRGEPLTTFNGPVSFRMIPGRLFADYSARWTTLTNGAGTGYVRASHVFGKAKIWVEDRPPEPIIIEGELYSQGLPTEPEHRTNATGVSADLHFEEPTLAKLQEPSIFDNRESGSPFPGTFVSVGRAPIAGQQLVHDCPDDLARHGSELMMVVTGIDASGFWITDINSCRVKERIYTADPRPVPEPDGFFPGTFGSIYVYNYNHPDGLNVGDLLWAVTGSIQEFTSTTQLTFASWNIRDSVRLLPQSQWNKYLDLVPIHEFTARTCGLATAPHLYDNLCAYSTRSLKVESLESTLVRVRNVKLPNVFPVCDTNADNQVEFFCDNGSSWTVCSSTPPSQVAEAQCHIDCQTNGGAYARQYCSEGTSFQSFGQIIVEMAGPGPEAAGLDASIAARTGQVVTTGATSARTTTAYGTDTQIRIWCDGPVHYELGGSTVTASTANSVLAGNTLLEHYMDPGETHVAFVSADASAHQCTVVANPRTKVLTTLKDVVPELNELLDCNPADTSAANEQCRFLHGARYDITGHLRQVQPARPRWMVIPRDVDDLCCHPGPGMQCPTPIEACP